MGTSRQERAANVEVRAWILTSDLPPSATSLSFPFLEERSLMPRIVEAEKKRVGAHHGR